MQNQTTKETNEVRVVVPANARIEELTVVVKSLDTVVAGSDQRKGTGSENFSQVS